MRSLNLVFAALLLACGSAAAAYTCDPTTCTKPDCACASTSPPGGLIPADAPMFVLLTHDDAVNTLQNRVVRTVTDGFKNPNGCNVPATWFAIKNKSNCTFVQQLVKDNHEIAGHTMNHEGMVASLTEDEMEVEIAGIKQYMVETCGVPADKFKGFRGPYLVHNEKFRNVLKSNGFEYDSSIMEPFNTVSSPSWAQRTFPYTMDAGIPQDCAWPGNTEMSCSTDEKHEGLWEIPVWMLPDAAGANGFTMDPVAPNADELFELLKKGFDAAYEGNRAPFPVFLHAPWFTYENTQGLMRFMEYATNKQDTWFVTASQLIDWMKDPVPASQVGNRLVCNMVELNPPTMEYCRQYKVGQTEDIWTVGGKWGIATDEALLAVNEGIIDGKSKWNLPEGTVVNLPPWDERCEKAGATFFAEEDWYKPVYTEKTWPSTTTPAPAPAPVPAPMPAPAAAPVVDAPAPVPSTTTTVPAPAPTVAAAPTQQEEPQITPGGDAVPAPVDTRSGASSTAASAGAMLMAAVAALCLLF